jgi:hypothetical protein
MKFYPHFTALQPYFCELDCTKGKNFYEPNAFILNTQNRSCQGPIDSGNARHFKSITVHAEK